MPTCGGTTGEVDALPPFSPSLPVLNGAARCSARLFGGRRSGPGTRSCAANGAASGERWHALACAVCPPPRPEARVIRNAEAGTHSVGCHVQMGAQRPSVERQVTRGGLRCSIAVWASPPSSECAAVHVSLHGVAYQARVMMARRCGLSASCHRSAPHDCWEHSTPVGKHSIPLRIRAQHGGRLLLPAPVRQRSAALDPPAPVTT